MSDPTREEALAHFGVKGMKWGVRKASRPTSADIKRARVSTQAQYHATVAQGSKAHTAKPGKTKEREMQKFDKMRMEYLKNPDRATALRMTNGEKAALAIIGSAAISPAGAAILGGSRLAVRKGIERQQRKLNEKK